MLERHIGIWGAAPRQAAADGGYASRANLSGAKAWGVRDMAFHKKSGLRIEDMVKSRWVYRKLRNFRAGIEGGILALAQFSSMKTKGQIDCGPGNCATRRRFISRGGRLRAKGVFYRSPRAGRSGSASRCPS
jgi:IS5 family transposase